MKGRGNLMSMSLLNICPSQGKPKLNESHKRALALLDTLLKKEESKRRI